MSLFKKHHCDLEAKDISDAIGRGDDIDLYRTKITGDLVLSEEQAAQDRSDSNNSEITDGDSRIVTSRIKIRHCTFAGDVIFTNMVFRRKVSFAGSIFEAVFRPDGSEFKEKADFSWTNFYNIADFSFMKFEGDVTFQEAVFRENKGVGGVQAEFNHSKFNGEAEFMGTIFGGKAVFLGSRFRDIAHFSNAIFFKEVQFDDSRFNESAWFYACKFEENANFSNVKFDREVIFSHSTFNKELRMNGSELGTIYFEGFESKSILEAESKVRIMDLKDVNLLINQLNKENNSLSLYIKNKLSPEIRDLLQKTQDGNDLSFDLQRKLIKGINKIIFDPSFLDDKPFPQKGLPEIAKSLMEQGDKDPRINRIILENAYPEAIKKAESLFGVTFGESARIYLEGSFFDRLFIRWHIIKKRLDKNTNPSVYLSLINGYRNLGWTKDEDDCYFHYRSLRNNNRLSRKFDEIYNLILNRFNSSEYIDAIACISCGYGVRLGRTLLLGIMLIILYAGLYWLNFVFTRGCGIVDRSIVSVNITVEKLGANLFQTSYDGCFSDTSLSLVNALYQIPRAIYFSVAALTSQISSNWYINGYWAYIVMSERILGWLLMALFIAVLTRKFIR